MTQTRSSFVTRLFWGLGLTALCCCGLAGALVAEVGALLRDDGRVVSLGLATAPPSSLVDGGAWYRWSARPLEPPGREVGYALAPAEALAVAAAEQRVAEELGYRVLDGGIFTLHITRDCRADLVCAYRKVAENDSADVAQLTRLFLEHAKTNGLGQRALAVLIVTFVQNLRYQQPDESVPFGLLPPALVAAEGWGDCDSKGLLAAMMLRGVGIDAVVLTSDRFRHAAVGVALPGAGMRVAANGRSYLYWEVTSPDWPPGDIKPTLNKPHLWKVNSLDSRRP